MYNLFARVATRVTSRALLPRNRTLLTIQAIKKQQTPKRRDNGVQSRFFSGSKVITEILFIYFRL
jgi:hypothetical protein